MSGKTDCMEEVRLNFGSRNALVEVLEDFEKRVKALEESRSMPAIKISHPAFRVFARTSLSSKFSSAWSSQQDLLLRCVEMLPAREKLRRRVLVERGIGTTTILSSAALWLTLFGIFKHVLFISRTEGFAKAVLSDIENDLLFGGQRLRSELKWFATSRGFLEINDSIISATGVNCSLRGLSRNIGDVGIRPDAVLVDLCLFNEDYSSISSVEKIRRTLDHTIHSIGSVGSPASILIATTSAKFL
jgi:hypothetical protein